MLLVTLTLPWRSTLNISLSADDIMCRAKDESPCKDAESFVNEVLNIFV